MILTWVCLGGPGFTVYAQPNPKIAEPFRQAFFSDSIYQESRCYDNVYRFIDQLRDRSVSLRGTYVLGIKNKGIQDFGMVAAHRTRVHYTQNWFHHVVLYDGKYIYDFDFTSKPKPIEPAEYFHQMFKTEKQKTNRKSCDETLGRYEISFIPVKAQDSGSRYDGEQVRMMKDIPGWGCDYTGTFSGSAE